MKKTTFTIFILLLISINSFAQGKGQKKYLPKQFKDLYFGMDLSSFKKVRNIEKMKKDTIMGFRTEYFQENIGDGVYEVIYYFTKGEKGILYEMIIDFEFDYDIESELPKLYGEEFGAEEFTLECGENFKLRAWGGKKRLVIAAKIKNTEWDE